uniref:Nudix hydrolase domain-containing protein n=1 Tax=Heterosigma akashiwo TaxID=2829 RepID=A0A6V1RGZ5_HETAK|mmetsp:Transcript_44952/g.70350  ORF Transcript_44952/g.70350 Transcript_44952/m.70350 type:complete len:271 (-) Transcript_44952:161-973(-)
MSLQKKELAYLTAIFLFLILVLSLNLRSVPTPFHEEDGGVISRSSTKFKGKPWRTAQTIAAEQVVSTEFGACELHSVRTETGGIVTDWLWWDEYDQINVVVHLAASLSTQQQQSASDENEMVATTHSTTRQGDRKFVMFRQRKYGLEGETLATVGGLVDPGEDAASAASRELREELGLVAGRWVPLGAYRTSSNRGGGFLNAFLALDCDYAEGVTKDNFTPTNDLEKQQQVLMTQNEVEEALLNGEFKEVKWTATVSLALHWLDNNNIFL